MERKKFLKQLALGGVSFSVLQSFTKDNKCQPTASDTEGPFPTKEPATLVTQNIISDRVGQPLTIKITVNDINNNCKGIQGAIVDIWHCDNKGEYSEYGGGAMFPPPGGKGGAPGQMPPPPGGGRPPRGPEDKNDSLHRPPMNGGFSMQAADHTKEHFLRGRQITNADGIASFISIFPGWYPGRAPHIHVHIYSKNGKSLLVTQIAFPEEIAHEVYTQGVYKDHGLPDTTNADDNVFNDSIANELGTVSGNNNDGYVLTHSIYIKA